MLDVTPTPLQRLLRERRRGYSLEAPFYTSPEIFAADLEIIFGRHWIYVGVEPDVPEPGDVMVVDIGKASVAIVRDDDGAVRAFHNVCRHRGARLVHDEKTTVGNLVCRYHSWTYRLTGELIHADHMGPGFDRACHGLKPVHIRSLEGLLFVCLAETPPADFDEMAARLGPYIAPHNIRGTKVAFQSDIVEPGNWKLTMENNRECYHCGTNHPELTVPLFAYGFGFSPEEMDEHDRELASRYACLLTDKHAGWEAEGLPSREIDELDTMITGFRTERLPLDGAGESHTIDTKAACRKLLGDFTTAKLGALSVWTQPNSWHHFMGDHIVTFAVLPLDAERSLLRTKWLVHKDAVEGVDYDLENLTGVWLATNDQDSTLVGYCQDGARSPAYEPGPYSPHTEMLVEKFCNWYVGRMRDALGQAPADIGGSGRAAPGAKPESPVACVNAQPKLTRQEPAAGLLGATRAWSGEEDDTLVCRAVRDETHDVRTFVFAPRVPHRFAYRPGQFLTFSFEIGGETIHRCYTISSAPTRPDTVSITVKRVTGGPVSNWLHDTIRPGAAVKVLGPMGEFSCFEHPAEKYLFLSGGSGITPLMSMARTFHDLGIPRDIVFVHAARTPADIVFADELALMSRLQPAFRVAAICEADAPLAAWAGHRGRISRAFLELVAPDLREREIFVCGPSPFMAAAKSILAEAGCDMARHHQESFDFAELSADEKAEALEAEAELDAGPATVPVYAVEFAKTKRSVQVRGDETVLASARRQGIRLPSSCTKGMCGTCKSKVLSGTVAMTHAGGIRQREIDAGMALLCCSKPTSDLVVER